MATTAAGPRVLPDAVEFFVADEGGEHASVALAQDLRRPRSGIPFVHETGGWRLTVSRPEVDRMEYLLELDGKLTPDPANPQWAPGPFGDKSVVEWPEYEPWRVDRINSLFRDFLANHPGRYRMVDLNKFVSPQGKFTDELNGQVIRGDGVHFTDAGAAIVAEWLAPQLEAIAGGGDPDPVDDTDRPDSRGLWAK